jgi:hypothetical protein
MYCPLSLGKYNTHIFPNKLIFVRTKQKYELIKKNFTDDKLRIAEFKYRSLNVLPHELNCMGHEVGLKRSH